MGWFEILQSFSDVDKTPPLNGQALVWDDLVLLWTPQTITTATGGGITDAPSDGSLYARQNAAWSSFTAGSNPTLSTATLTVLTGFIKGNGTKLSADNSTYVPTNSTETYAFNCATASTATFALLASTATYAITSSSATFALLASTATWAVNSGTANTATYAILSSSSTYALLASTATYAITSSSATFALLASTATYAITSSTATFALLSSTATYAITSSTATFAQALTLATPANVSGLKQHLRCVLIAPNQAVTASTTFCLIPVTDAALTITQLDVTCDADPTTEITGDVKVADAYIGLGNARLVNDFDTTAGIRQDTTISSGAVAASKCIYLSFDAVPEAALKTITFDLQFDYD